MIVVPVCGVGVAAPSDVVDDGATEVGVTPDAPNAPEVGTEGSVVEGDAVTGEVVGVSVGVGVGVEDVAAGDESAHAGWVARRDNPTTARMTTPRACLKLPGRDDLTTERPPWGRVDAANGADFRA